ncbi:sensor histidine kinase [Amycolatopsis jiangsuensis]|uniref:Oxygen sensor histidine kinase NreB n=1 Tax=Amycolatopsis jiangsuensis TaxID=1181879 RepID=A0A840IYC0_9PSEU|nr:sensor histidine kinase [Amycolatopsis jiangsuensis]MBB4686202.1 signal transduction histidine kinase [Amycolatopsis jiangsuensis]
MIGIRPGAIDPRTERRAGPTVTAIGIAALTVCTIIAGTQDHGSPAQWRTTLILAAAIALWLLVLIPLVPRRTENPWRAVGFFAVLLIASTFLATRMDTFTAFASVGYPIAFVLFPARWSIFAAAATALVPLLAKGIWHAETPPWVTVVSVVGPVLYAAWFVGAESEERRRTNQKLTAALAENAALQERLLVQARESGVRDERQRMAREIHDTVAQGLTGIVTQLHAADQAACEDDRQRHLGHVHALAKDSLSEARRAVQALRPEPLADSRLPEALAGLAERLAGRTGTEVTARTDGATRPLPPEAEETLYRVTQEALANAEKHAEATRIAVTLTYTDGSVLLDIRDDGLGFTAGDRGEGTGFGLEAMRQRVRRTAGTLTIESAPGDGTVVHVQLPAR